MVLRPVDKERPVDLITGGTIRVLGYRVSGTPDGPRIIMDRDIWERREREIQDLNPGPENSAILRGWISFDGPVFPVEGNKPENAIELDEYVKRLSRLASLSGCQTELPADEIHRLGHEAHLRWRRIMKDVEAFIEHEDGEPRRPSAPRLGRSAAKIWAKSARSARAVANRFPTDTRWEKPPWVETTAAPGGLENNEKELNLET